MREAHLDVHLRYPSTGLCDEDGVIGLGILDDGQKLRGHAQRVAKRISLLLGTPLALFLLRATYLSAMLLVFWFNVYLLRLEEVLLVG